MFYNDNVYVIRADNIDRLKEFLEHFGLSFVEEKHGSGPVHYSCEVENRVLEIYPEN